MIAGLERLTRRYAYMLDGEASSPQHLSLLHRVGEGLSVFIR